MVLFLDEQTEAEKGQHTAFCKFYRSQKKKNGECCKALGRYMPISSQKKLNIPNITEMYITQYISA